MLLHSKLIGSPRGMAGRGRAGQLYRTQLQQTIELIVLFSGESKECYFLNYGCLHRLKPAYKPGIVNIFLVQYSTLKNCCWFARARALDT